MSIERTSSPSGAIHPSIFTNLTEKLKKIIERIVGCVKSLFEKFFPNLFQKTEPRSDNVIKVTPPTPNKETESKSEDPVKPLERPTTGDDWESVSRASSTGGKPVSPRPAIEPGISNSGNSNLKPDQYNADIFINLSALDSFDHTLQNHQLPRKKILDEILEAGVKRYQTYQDHPIAKQGLSIEVVVATSENFRVGELSENCQNLQAPIRLENQSQVEKWIERVYSAFTELGLKEGFVKALIVRGTQENPRTFGLWARRKERPVGECEMYLLDPRGKDESSPISFHQFKKKESFCNYFSRVAAPFSEKHLEENYYWVKPLVLRR